MVTPWGRESSQARGSPPRPEVPFLPVPAMRLILPVAGM